MRIEIYSKITGARITFMHIFQKRKGAAAVLLMMTLLFSNLLIASSQFRYCFFPFFRNCVCVLCINQAHACTNNVYMNKYSFILYIDRVHIQIPNEVCACVCVWKCKIRWLIAPSKRQTAIVVTKLVKKPCFLLLLLLLLLVKFLNDVCIPPVH